MKFPPKGEFPQSHSTLLLLMLCWIQSFLFLPSRFPGIKGYLYVSRGVTRGEVM